MQRSFPSSRGPEVADAVTRIWQVLGLSAPMEPIGARFDFELEDTPVEIARTPDGAALRITATLGHLAGDPHLCDDQLSRLLRLSLALVGVNRAVLSFPAGQDAARIAELSRPDHAPEAVYAEIVIAEAAEAVEALRELMQWRSFAGDVIAPVGQSPDAGAPVAPRALDPADMVIFQP
ncbi:hypothetical protein [Celeribacter naphthalenivorans]|uniref:hypothetical protein n=1 Tax=Celeribacter naphthalenivorans TaxID=1614694 RepID=UPI001CFAE46A|nr:hypothetical protein [Celeribacter naphthalenivorans]